LSLLSLFELALIKHTILPGLFATATAAEATPLASAWTIKATFANADVLSAYLVLGFPLLLCQLMHARTRSGRDFWLVSTTLAFTGILLTQDLLSLMVLFVTCAVFLSYTSSRTIPLLICLFLIPLLLLGAWDESVSPTKMPTLVHAKFTQAAQALSTDPFRSLLVGSGIKTRQPHPGLETTEQSELDACAFGNMHCSLIQETGLLGWFFMLWIFGATLRTLYWGARQAMDPYHHGLLWAIFSSVIGFLISMGDLNTFFHLPLQILFWGLVGLGLGMTTHIVSKRSPFYVIWRFGDDRPRAEKSRVAAQHSHGGQILVPNADSRMPTSSRPMS
jgi:hypothetical protein